MTVRPIRIAFVLLGVLGTGCGAVGNGGAPEPSATADPPAAAPAIKHLVYLHGRIIEDEGRRPTHPRFGVYEYQEILDAFAAAGFTVHSDQRPAGSSPPEWAAITATEIRGLLDQGIPARDITVVGFSKGGVIAVLTALELGDPEVNFVFIACCGPWIDEVFDAPGERIRGRMLSIYEASDTTGSCRGLFDHASTDAVTAEVELHIGGGHGAFYRPHTDWIEPVLRWASGEDPLPAAVNL